MELIHNKSLGATLDALNEVFFQGHSLTKAQRKEVALWVADRQGKPGAYAEMFAPMELDFKKGVRLFTGETIRSRAATAHILGEEACRALLLLECKIPAVDKALARATLGIRQRIVQAISAGYPAGMYCCGTCTSSLWRHLASGGIKEIDAERWLTAGVKILKSHRLGNGEWRRFAFFYTLLALSEMQIPSAVAELRYAAPRCERYLRQAIGKDRYARRRRLLVERVLEKC